MPAAAPHIHTPICVLFTNQTTPTRARQVNASNGQAVWGNGMGEGEGVGIGGVLTLPDGQRSVVVLVMVVVGRGGDRSTVGNYTHTHTYVYNKYTHTNQHTPTRTYSFVYTANQFLSDEASAGSVPSDDDDDDTSTMYITTYTSIYSFYNTSQPFMATADDDGVPDHEVRVRWLDACVGACWGL